ncbi:MAG: hypothetical protein R2783_05565 [Gelidibacter sp.]
MDPLRKISILMTLLFLFTDCSTAQKLQKKAPITIENVYCQKWTAGVKGGGSGINLFIPVSAEMPQTIQLDSVYFRGKAAKLEKTKAQNILYVGRLETNFNSKQNIIMSSDPNEEYGNEPPKLEKKIPFDLNDSECVVSFKEGGETKYFKIENITEKPSQNYPSAPPNKHK